MQSFSLSAELNAPQQPNGTTFDAPDNSAGKGSRQVKGARLILKQFYALLVKRFHHAVRSQKDFVAQVQKRQLVMSDESVMKKKKVTGCSLLSLRSSFLPVLSS